MLITYFPVVKSNFSLLSVFALSELSSLYYVFVFSLVISTFKQSALLNQNQTY